MKYFLSTCICLMIVAGIYGATDMSRDLAQDRLIDYENVRYRHAKHLLAIIKTTGLGTYKFRGAAAGKNPTQGVEKKVRQDETKEHKVVEYLEEFSRGDEGIKPRH